MFTAKVVLTRGYGEVEVNGQLEVEHLGHEDIGELQFACVPRTGDPVILDGISFQSGLVVYRTCHYPFRDGGLDEGCRDLGNSEHWGRKGPVAVVILEREGRERAERAMRKHREWRIEQERRRNEESE